jgi:mRNA interferase MazF
MTNFSRGDVVLVDLGVIAKVRPCVIVSISNPDSMRRMAVVVPMTTQIRGGECEVRFPKPRWLRDDAVVNLLGISGVDIARVERRLGTFPGAMPDIDAGLCRMLGLPLPQQLF